MSEIVFEPLLRGLRETQEPALWIADENNAGVLASLSQVTPSPVVMTNRVDIAVDAKALGLRTQYSDFNFAQFLGQKNEDDAAQADARFRHLFYRISKERALSNYIINEAFRHLPVGGCLWLAGQKNEGIKTYHTQANRLFKNTGKLQKSGNIYSAKLIKTTDHGDRLDDQDYTRLRWIEPAKGVGFYSKPGTYGWNKIDKGSEYLISQLPALLDGIDPATAECLDLGCGYGYITVGCRHLPFHGITATDNNAAAIASATANVQHYQLPASVIADDCAANIQRKFQLILCNPPFHQGFDVESNLTDKFLLATRRLLAPAGTAGFVVNSFIPLEAKAQKLLAPPEFRTQVLGNNGQFKVIQIQRV